MEITFLGTGAPLHVSRATTGMLVTADGCGPLLIDTCGGFELARNLNSAGFQLAQIRNVIVTHRHFDHSGGLMALFLASMPLDIHALDDTYRGICEMKAGSMPDTELHQEVRHHKSNLVRGARSEDWQWSSSRLSIAYRRQQSGLLTADEPSLSALIACHVRGLTQQRGVRTYSSAIPCARSGTEMVHAIAHEVSCTRRRGRLPRFPSGQAPIAWRVSISRGSVQPRIFWRKHRRFSADGWRYPMMVIAI